MGGAAEDSKFCYLVYIQAFYLRPSSFNRSTRKIIVFKFDAKVITGFFYQFFFEGARDTIVY